jgi:hypothetical protein
MLYHLGHDSWHSSAGLTRFCGSVRNPFPIQEQHAKRRHDHEHQDRPDQNVEGAEVERVLGPPTADRFLGGLACKSAGKACLVVGWQPGGAEPRPPQPACPRSHRQLERIMIGGLQHGFPGPDSNQRPSG